MFKYLPRRILLHCGLPVLFVFAMFVSTTHMQVLQHDTDEGVNLMKALLVARGYRLFRPIWSDQPPVFTLLLAAEFKIFGTSVESGRLLVISLAALLLWAFHQTVRRLEDITAATAATVFAVASHRFIELSCEVMVGLPAIAVGMVAIWMAVEWRKARPSLLRWTWLIGSFLIMALSVQTKFFTLTMVPTILMLIVLPSKMSRETHQDSQKLLLPGPWLAVTVWTIGLFGSLTMMAFLTSENWQELLAPHLRAEMLPSTYFDFSKLFLDVIDGAPYLVFFAALGLGASLYRNRFQSLAPAAWLATACLTLMYHRPLRTHYAPLIGIPLCWMAGLGIQAVVWAATMNVRKLRSVERRAESDGIRIPRRRMFIAALVTILTLSMSMAPVVIQSATRIADENRQLTAVALSDETNESAVVKRLDRYRDQTHWVFSDQLIYPFCDDLPAPPELAVITEKRITTGFLSDDYLVGMLRRYRPEQIYIGRFNYGPKVMDYIAGNYVAMWQSPSGSTQYLQKQIARIAN